MREAYIWLIIFTSLCEEVCILYVINCQILWKETLHIHIFVKVVQGWIAYLSQVNCEGDYYQIYSVYWFFKISCCCKYIISVYLYCILTFEVIMECSLCGKVIYYITLVFVIEDVLYENEFILFYFSSPWRQGWILLVIVDFIAIKWY